MSDQSVAEAYTTQTQETNIHAVSGNRTRNPSNLAAADRAGTGIDVLGLFTLREL